MTTNHTHSANVAELRAELSRLRQRVTELEETASSHLEIAAKLEQSQAMLQLIIDNIPQAIFWKDHALNFLGCNQRFAQDAGLAAPEQIVGKSDYDMPWTDLAETFRADELQVVTTGKAKINAEEPLQKADGSQSWLRVSKVPLHNQAGEVIAILGMYEHIGERKKIESELRTFYALAENAPDPIAVGRLDTNLITYANPAFREALGYGNETIGLPFMATYAEEDADQLQHAVQSALERGIWRGVLTYKRKDGGTFKGQLSGMVLRDEDGQPQAIGGIVRDISNQLQAEEERATLQEQVIIAQRAALRELSTPLIPLVRGVVAMPLIGSMDSLRVQQVMETLLEGIAQHDADTAILDITGLPVVDTQVADALIRAAQAVKLLGAQVVITGIAPEVAQTLVSVGADLSSIKTLSNLQSGIAYALEREHQR